MKDMIKIAAAGIIGVLLNLVAVGLNWRLGVDPFIFFGFIIGLIIVELEARHKK